MSNEINVIKKHDAPDEEFVEKSKEKMKSCTVPPRELRKGERKLENECDEMLLCLSVRNCSRIGERYVTME